MMEDSALAGVQQKNTQENINRYRRDPGRALSKRKTTTTLRIKVSSPKTSSSLAPFIFLEFMRFRTTWMRSNTSKKRRRAKAITRRICSARSKVLNFHPSLEQPILVEDLLDHATFLTCGCNTVGVIDSSELFFSGSRQLKPICLGQSQKGASKENKDIRFELNQIEGVRLVAGGRLHKIAVTAKNETFDVGPQRHFLKDSKSKAGTSG